MNLSIHYSSNWLSYLYWVNCFGEGEGNCWCIFFIFFSTVVNGQEVKIIIVVGLGVGVGRVGDFCGFLCWGILMLGIIRIYGGSMGSIGCCILGFLGLHLRVIFCDGFFSSLGFARCIFCHLCSDLFHRGLHPSIFPFIFIFTYLIPS